MKNLVYRKFRTIVKMILIVIPFGKKIVESLGSNWAYKRNFGNIKFHGQFLQDMIAYMYLTSMHDGGGGG
jgi:hypothetical protein